MPTDDGGESDRLAPVTPLFAGRNLPQTRSVPSRQGRTPVFREDPEPDLPPPAEFPQRGQARDGVGRARRTEGADRTDRSARVARGERAARAAGGARTDDGTPPTAEEAAAAGERVLLRKLAARSLSVQEARTVLAAQEVASNVVDAVIDRMRELGYLDDAGLAEQLVHAGVERRGQGRHAIAQTLMKRGVPREVADAALAELPDDDLERALEFARKKASSVGGKDPQAALRRLVGQLSRRGYPSGVAMAAARQALDER